MRVASGLIVEARVVRGAPCGASWPALARIIQLPVDQAVLRMGLEVQFFCSADPAGWDPIHGKSPVHFAGNVHARALQKAVDQGCNGV